MDDVFMIRQDFDLEKAVDTSNALAALVCDLAEDVLHAGNLNDTGKLALLYLADLNALLTAEIQMRVHRDKRAAVAAE